MRLWVGVLLSVVLGALATFLSGESEISWAFLLIDIPLVAVSSMFSLAVVKRLRTRPAGETR
jgi:high-affinity Fe2+/Pb2+ permease